MTMNIDEVKKYLNELTDKPDLLDSNLSIHELTIHEIIRAEKKYSYGLDNTTSSARQAEIERIVLLGIGKYNNEDKKN